MNNEMRTIRDIVIPLDQYPHIRNDEPIGNGVAKLLQHCSADGRHLHYEKLLVINSSNQLVGHLSVKDILTSFFPSILAPGATSVYVGKKERYTDLSILLEDSFRKECRRQATHTVGEYMTAAHKSIDGNMSLFHALEIMVKDGESTLPVTENKKLLGAIRITDIFRVLGTHCTL